MNGDASINLWDRTTLLTSLDKMRGERTVAEFLCEEFGESAPQGPVEVEALDAMMKLLR